MDGPRTCLILACGFLLDFRLPMFACGLRSASQAGCCAEEAERQCRLSLI